MELEELTNNMSKVIKNHNDLMEKKEEILSTIQKNYNELGILLVKYSYPCQHRNQHN